MPCIVCVCWWPEPVMYGLREKDAIRKTFNWDLYVYIWDISFCRKAIRHFCFFLFAELNFNEGNVNFLWKLSCVPFLFSRHMYVHIYTRRKFSTFFCSDIVVWGRSCSSRNKFNGLFQISRNFSHGESFRSNIDYFYTMIDCVYSCIFNIFSHGSTYL